MFVNLAIVRRYYIDKWINKIEENKKKKEIETEDIKDNQDVKITEA